MGRRIGDAGEDLAAAYLERQGYSLLARNLRIGMLELDLIVERDGVVVFVEVKTRKGHRQGHPEEFVGAVKQARMVRAATMWLIETGHEGEIRFDVVAVTQQPGRDPEILHIPDAFFPHY